MRRILCLYLPHWPIQRLLAARKGSAGAKRSRGGLRHRSSPTPGSGPCILLHAHDSRRGDLVVACNAKAHERGVRLQMPLTEAATLAGHRGECLVLPHDPAADLAALARLAKHCERFSPLVGWQTVAGRASPASKLPKKPADDFQFQNSPGPDCLFLDVTRIGVLFGGEENLIGEVIADLSRLGYQARVAVADTIGAAWAAVRQLCPMESLR